MPGTHYGDCAVLDSALSVHCRHHLAFSVCGQGKVDCRAGKTGNLPGGLFARATVNFSVFTHVMISLSAIYYKYAYYASCAVFLCMKCAAI